MDQIILLAAFILIAYISLQHVRMNQPEQRRVHARSNTNRTLRRPRR